MGIKFNLIIPKCREICYNISLYQTLFVEIQQKAWSTDTALVNGVLESRKEKFKEDEKIESVLKIV